MPPVQHPLVPVAPAPLGPPATPRPGLVAGAGAMLTGLGILVKTPALWPLALVPAAIGTAITAALSAVAVGFVPGLVAQWLGAEHATLGVIAGVLATVVAIVLALVVGFGLAQPLSGFALEKIVHHVEASEGATAWPQTSFLTNLKRSLASVAMSWAFGMPVLALLLIVNFVFPPAVVVTVPLKLMVVALLVAWDLCDYPLSIRGVPIRERVAFMGRNAGAMIGFGFGLALISLLPCALFLAIPAGVAGATRLIAAIERAEGRRLVGKSEGV
jgi:CysZ protein